MSTSKIINDFNICLFREKIYDFKFNANKFKKKTNDIKSLFDSIKSNNSKNEFDSKFNDSLTTVEALNNPHLVKLSKYLPKVRMNNYELYKKRINSSKKNYNIKTLDILRYSDCVKISQNRNESINFYKHNIVKNKRKNSCLKFKDEFKVKKEDMKDIYCVRNELFTHLSKDKFNMNTNRNNAREIKRFEVDTSNIFLIQRPLITTIRGKILKNTKKRFKRPIRSIIKSNIFYNYQE